MIKPHGAETLNPRIVGGADRAGLEAAAADLPSAVVASGAAASAVMLASGYFTPCDGFMDLETALSVAADMRFPESGLLWPVPVVNILPAERAAAAGCSRAVRDWPCATPTSTAIRSSPCRRCRRSASCPPKTGPP